MMTPQALMTVGAAICCLPSLSLVHGFTGRAIAVPPKVQLPHQSRQRRNVQPLLPTNANSFRRSLLLNEREDSSTSTIQQHEANKGGDNDDGSLDNKKAFLPSLFQSSRSLPPPEVEDFSVLLYDVLLLLNLTASVSFWVTHRYSFAYLGVALSEGCGLSVCWIAAGLLSGSFLYSAAHGHKGVTEDTTATDVAVGTLALNTFVNAVNLRLMFALILAVLQHRPVGSGVGEDLLGLELGFGLVLMPLWRLMHGRYVTGRMM